MIFETLNFHNFHFRNADHIVIGGGAGISVSAGLDYTDKVDFAKRYPQMVCSLIVL
jgi:NAD-dependent SIR2 family protein deacetylase